MLSRIEDFFLNKFLGKLIARAAVLGAGFLMGPQVAGPLAKAGISISVDPARLAELGALASSCLFEYFKKRRMANPASPAVQTDAAAPGAKAKVS